MPNYAYAICYCSLTRDMLVFMKRKRAYFYGNTYNKNSHVVENVFHNGENITHGGGLYCFPGGGRNARYAVDDAMREFMEETGIYLRNYQINEYYTIEIDAQPYAYGVFFDFSPQVFGKLYADVTKSLNDKNDAVNQFIHAVKQKKIAPLNPRQPKINHANQGLDFFNTRIKDDELDAVGIKSIDDYAIYFGDNIFTGWFREFVRDFTQTYPRLRE